MKTHRLAAHDSFGELQGRRVAREDDVEPVGQWAMRGGDRLPGLAAHDHRVHLADLVARIDLGPRKARHAKMLARSRASSHLRGAVKEPCKHDQPWEGGLGVL